VVTSSVDHLGLRTIFDEDAERYDRARPRYPEQVFDDLGELTGEGPGGRILEIGCGTGQATVPLAERGYEIVAVELGANLTEVARRNLARYASTDVIRAGFEDWDLPPDPFDVVFAATSWHWLEPRTRTAKTAAALHPGGSLAILNTHHVQGGTEQFFVDVQSCYERWDPSTQAGLRLVPASEIGTESDEVEESKLFEPVATRRYEWEQEYTTESYLDVLLTYSGHRALEPAAREGLLACIGDLINHGYEGHITKGYMAELRVARRRGD
jgi:SAM-dependent methyltransferase